MILIVYLFYILVCGLSPFTFSLDPSSSLVSLYDEKFDTHSVFWAIPLWDVVSNVLLYVPLGFLFFGSPVFSRCNPASKILLSGVVSCALSFIVESSQLILPREASLVDIFLNTLGGMAGAMLATSLYAPLRRITQRYWMGLLRSSWLSPLLIVYVIVLLTISVLPLPVSPNFNNWDPDFGFQLGNEATLNRPWLGKIFLVAIYNRALPSQEVFTNFLAGPRPNSAQTRIKSGLVVFYDFTEGSGTIVHDHSTMSPTLDLLIQDPAHVNWIRPNGVEFLGNTVITHSKPARRLYSENVFRDSELTVESWIAPTHVNQSGPARIVSYSQDTGLRNFTLGQDQKNVVFRLRTPLSGLNGTTPQLQSKDDPLITDSQHLVVTYREGLETLYVNGLLHETILLNKKVYAFGMMDEILGRNYRWSYMFLLIFPVGFCSYLLFARNRNHAGIPILLSTLIGLVVIGVVEGSQVATLSREFDLFVLPVWAGTIFLSSLTSAVLSQKVKIS